MKKHRKKGCQVVISEFKHRYKHKINKHWAAKSVAEKHGMKIYKHEKYSNSNIVIDDITIGITVKSSFVSKNGNNCRLLELNNNKEKKKLSFIACREVLDWNYYYYFK